MAVAHHLHDRLGVPVGKLTKLLGLLSEVLKGKVKAARGFAMKLRGLLKQALALWHKRRAGPTLAADFAARVEQVKAEVTRHLRNRRLTDRDNQRRLDGLGRCHGAGSPPRFLEPPTGPDSPPPAATIPFASGIRPTPRRSPNSEGPIRTFMPWSSAPTVAGWSPARVTSRSELGTPTPVSREQGRAAPVTVVPVHRSRRAATNRSLAVDHR